MVSEEEFREMEERLKKAEACVEALTGLLAEARAKLWAARAAKKLRAAIARKIEETL